MKNLQFRYLFTREVVMRIHGKLMVGGIVAGLLLAAVSRVQGYGYSGYCPAPQLGCTVSCHSITSTVWESVTSPVTYNKCQQGGPVDFLKSCTDVAASPGQPCGTAQDYSAAGCPVGAKVGAAFTVYYPFTPYPPNTSLCGED